MINVKEELKKLKIKYYLSGIKRAILMNDETELVARRMNQDIAAEFVNKVMMRLVAFSEEVERTGKIPEMGKF